MSNFKGAILNAAYALVMTGNIWMAAAAFVATAWQDKEVRRQQRNARNAYNNSLNDRLNLVRATSVPRRRIYGEDLVGGLAYVIGSSGALKEYLHIIVVHAAHECDAIVDVYYNDVLVTTDANGNATSAPYAQARSDLQATKSGVYGSNVGGGTTTLDYTPVAGSIVASWSDGGGDNGGAFGLLTLGTDYTVSGNVITWLKPSNGYTWTVQHRYTQTTPYAKIRKYLGTPTQAADADLIAAFPGKWTAAHQGKGLCYTAHTLRYSEDVFPSGIPEIKVRVRGAKLFDPRTSTTAWTDNPALVARDYLLIAKVDGGLGCTTAEVDDTSDIAAANISDETVAIDASTTQKRYAMGLSIDPPFNRSGFQQILDCMGGDATYVQGKWIIYAGAYQSPTLTLTDADVIDTMDPVVDPGLPDDQVCNEVHGQFIDPAQYWRSTDYPAVKNATYLAQDNNIPHIDTLTFAGVQDSLRAQRLAKQHLDRARQGMSYQAAFGLKAYKLMPGQTVALSIAENGWASKVFRCITRSFSVTEGVKLTLREEAAAAYDWNYGQALTFDPAPNTTLRSPFDVPTPGALTIASNDAYLMMMGDGTLISRMRVSWAQATDAGVLNGGKCIVEWWRADQSVSAAQHLELPGDATQALIGPVADGAIYLVRLRWHNGLVGGQWTQAAHQVIGKTAAPPNPTSLTVATTAALKRRFSIVLPATLPLDIAGFVLRSASGNVSTWGSMTWFDDGVLTAADAGRTVVVEFDDPPAGTWSFGCKLVDTSGNESAGAVFASNLTLGAQPVDGSRSFNLLKNSHWTEYTGTNTGIAALKDWQSWTGSAPSGWAIFRSRQANGATDGRWTIVPGGCYLIDFTNIGDGSKLYSVYQTAPCIAGETYEASFIGAALACAAALQITFLDAGGAEISDATVTDGQDAGIATLGGPTPEAMNLWWLKAVAPANAVSVRYSLIKWATNAGASGSWLMCNHAYLGVAPAGVTRSTRTPWSAAGVSQLHGGGLLDGSVQTPAITDHAATDVVSTSIASVTLTADRQSSGHFTPNTVGTLSYTPPYACDLILTAAGYAASVLGTSGSERIDLGFSTLADNADEVGFTDAVTVLRNDSYSPGSTVAAGFSVQKRISGAAAGVTQTWRLKGLKLNVAYGSNVTINNVNYFIEAIKK